MIGNDCLVGQEHRAYNKSTEYNCINSYEDILSFDILMREYNNT